MTPYQTKSHTDCPLRFWAAAVVLALLLCGGVDAAAAPKPKSFATPEEAVAAFVAALRSNDAKQLAAIFGPETKALTSSGDPVRDAQRRAAFIADYDRKNRLAPEGARVVLSVGDKDWPFPIPLVQAGARWVFDTRAGKEEILNRRVGENEIDTVQTLLAIVDAQREYAMQPRDADGVRKYAEKFASDPGKKNGLYWSTAPGEEQSPLGELVADARAEGYTRKGQDAGPRAVSRLLLPDPEETGQERARGGLRLRGQAQDDRRVCRRGLPGGLRELRRHDVHREPRRGRLPEEPRAGDRQDGCGDGVVRSRRHLEKGRVRRAVRAIARITFRLRL